MGNSVQCSQLNAANHQNLAYGEFTIEQPNGQIAIVQKSIDLSSMRVQQLWGQLTLRKTLNCSHIVKLYGIQFIERGNLMHILMRYEYLPCSLRNLLQQHILAGSYFCEQELIDMISGVQKGLRFLYRLGIHHGCINQQTILQSRKGLFKITDVSSTTYVRSYELCKRGEMNQALSQKMVNMFNLNILSTEVKRHLEIDDDLFSLGLVALAAALKIKVSMFYEYTSINEQRKTIQINYKKIDNYLKLARQKIGKEFAKRVQRLLTVNKQDHTYQNEDESYVTSECSNNLGGQCKNSNAINTL